MTSYQGNNIRLCDVINKYFSFEKLKSAAKNYLKFFKEFMFEITAKKVIFSLNCKMRIVLFLLRCLMRGKLSLILSENMPLYAIGRS